MSSGQKIKNRIQSGSEWLKKKWGVLPLVGPLVYCTRKNHLDTLKEFSVTVLFGTATFWVTALFLLPFKSNHDISYPSLVLRTMSTGQLFIFAVGMLGPILFIALEEPPNAKKFPGRTAHVVVLSLIAVIAAGFYSLELMARNQIGQIGSLVDTDFLFRASVVVAITILTFRYLTTVYRKSTISFDPESQMREPVVDFAKDFAARHRGTQ